MDDFSVEGRRVILASASPRRKELLEYLIDDFEVISSACEEDLPKTDGAEAYVLNTAKLKARTVLEGGFVGGVDGKRAMEGGGRGFVLIGMDTVVVGDGGEILEKPASLKEAAEMVCGYSGKVVQVKTGVWIVVDGEEDGFVESTDVEFVDISPLLAQAYVEKAGEEVLDYAGGFGYQRHGALLIKGIKGCAKNVLGLPLSSLALHLHKRCTKRKEDGDGGGE